MDISSTNIVKFVVMHLRPFGSESVLTTQGCIQKILPGGRGGGGGNWVHIQANDVSYNDYIYTSICLLRFALFA